ncbi:MAG TPA: exo-beta-N-acetylmuramidase NamZ domain-containing protein [Terriglobales bacterium]|nr:exo-beta-N-acetylmuramidase NamZ domain-containing protein [Terriglobales bacterium]
MMKRTSSLWLCLVLLTTIVFNQSLFAQAKKATPSKKSVAAASSRFAAVDAILKAAVAEKAPPGAVVVVGHNGRIVYRKAFGYRSLEPTQEPMTLDTVFDMASLTKCVATATAITRMFELGQIRLNDPVSKYLPEFAQNGKKDITIRQLVTHYSGLRPDLDLKEPWTGYETAIRMAMAEQLQDVPGSRFVYSDINYIVLGELIHKISGMSLDKYTEAHIFKPLKMTRTTFNPPIAWRPKIAATEYDENGVMLKGIVHDPTARRMGGVAGHAGLFSTGDDVAKYAFAMLKGGAPVLNELSVEKMSTPQNAPIGPSLRGIGWDIDSPFASNRGELLPVGSYGHTGFTGTSLWIDPVTNTFVVVLGNGVHPRGGAALVALRTKVATAVAAALKLTVSQKQKMQVARITGYNETMAAARRFVSRNGQVKTGIDVLQARNFDVLKAPAGRKLKVGIITNHSGLDSQGRRTIDVLAQAPGVELSAIFSPEHGIFGMLDTENITEVKDPATGVPVYSVYGNTDAKRRPSQDVLKDLDAVVYDIQDAGVRFYTYETTLGYFLEECAKAGKEVIVLDRPNPITGIFLQGPVMDASRSTFVGYHPTPVRHAMTIGELGQMYNAERKINAKLTVVKMEGWQRGDWYDATGLMWINPSPNLRSLTEAALYPGVGMIEGTNISVGRGTDTPFEVVGAPWIKPKEFADYLNARQIQGVRFVPITFKPNASKYKDQSCGGINIILTERNFTDSTLVGLELAAALMKLYPNDYKSDKLVDLVGNQAVVKALTEGVDPRRIAQDIQEDIDKFVDVRKKYLLY